MSRKPVDDHPDDFASHLAALQPQLRYFVLSLTGSVDDAEEIIQEANTIALRKRSDFQTGTSLKAWLFRIALLQCKSFHRARARRQAREIPDEGFLDQLSGQSETELDDERFERERTALLTCLAKLRIPHQELVLARHVHGRRVADLAVEHNVQPNALAQKLFRIRTRLARCVPHHLETAS